MDAKMSFRAGLVLCLALASAAAAGCGGDGGGTVDAGEDGAAPDGGGDGAAADAGDCGPNPCGACLPGCSPNDRCVGGAWECDCDCPPDGGSGDDAGPDDAGSATDAGEDAGPPMCDPAMEGCGGERSCECCPTGGPAQACLCSTPCTSDEDCTDPARPDCQQPAPDSEGFCAPTGFACCWLCA